jgi:hypothetical protein
MTRIAGIQDIDALLKALRAERESFKDDPAKARQWLIRIGILTKNGKKLARQYR